VILTWHGLQGERLQEVAKQLNERYFRGCLAVPEVRVGELPQAARFGCYTRTLGGDPVVLVSAKVLTGYDRRTLPGTAHAEHRRRLVEDVLLHELVHVATDQARLDEHGHGWMWWRCVRELSLRVGLPYPSEEEAFRWPLAVRPRGYYGPQDPLSPRPRFHDEENGWAVLDRFLALAAKASVSQAGWLLTMANLWDYSEEVVRRREVLDGAG